jgi:predicted nucleotidyltransferase component of viral defense system
MPFSDIYRRRVELLLRVLPSIAKEDRFALKGGTAINLFIRELPRLSVDIDLAYVHTLGWSRALPAITTAMRRIDASIRATVRGVRVTQVPDPGAENAITALNVQLGRAQVKIEISPVLRGCVFEPEGRGVSAAVEEEFGFAETQVLSFADLYAGKLVAALDRQHPRDLFDARELLANEGIDDAMRVAFVVYLLSHKRPMCEVLAVRRKNIADRFAQEFAGMTLAPVVLDELLETREELVRALVKEMPDDHREFLVSFELGNPKWDLLPVRHAKRLPAVKWRQRNLDSIPKKKRAKLVTDLEKVLDTPARLEQLTFFSGEE